MNPDGTVVSSSGNLTVSEGDTSGGVNGTNAFEDDTYCITTTFVPSVVIATPDSVGVNGATASAAGGPDNPAAAGCSAGTTAYVQVDQADSFVTGTSPLSSIPFSVAIN